MLRTLLVFVLLAVGSIFAVRSAVYAAALYLWIAYFRPESWAWSGTFASLNLSYYAGVFLVIRALVSAAELRVSWRSTLLLLFLMLTLWSTVEGLYADASWEYWYAFAKTITVSFLLTAVIKTEADLRLILLVITLSLGFEAGKQGWAGLILNPGAGNPNTIPFLGDNNVVAVGMAMMVPLLSALAATSTGWQKRGLQLLNVGLIYRGLSTYSRGGFLSFAAVGALTLWRSHRKGRAVAAVALVTALTLAVLPEQFWDRMATITADAEVRDESQMSRLHFWQVALVMANDRPILGVGHSAYEDAYDQYDWTNGRYGTRRSVHSAWFGVLAESGYSGFTLFVTILLSAWLACGRVRRMARRHEIPDSLGHYATGLQLSLIGFAVGGSFVPFQYVEMLWHVIALTFALDRIAVNAAQAARDSSETPTAEPPAVEEPTEDFAWA